MPLETNLDQRTTTASYTGLQGKTNLLALLFS
jgi:hypothetical protein